jgi:hypothetical protein
MPLYVSLGDAAALLAKVQRVLVIGCSGGGKTTFSAKIAAFRIWNFSRLTGMYDGFLGGKSVIEVNNETSSRSWFNANVGSWMAAGHLHSTSGYRELN